MSIRHSLEGYFQFRELGTDWRTETLAGLTTFLTMSYIIFVNPSSCMKRAFPRRRRWRPLAFRRLSAAS